MRQVLVWLVALVAVLFASVSSAATQHLWGPYFTADASHSSQIVVHNKRVRDSIQASVYSVSADGRRTLLATMPVEPNSSRKFVIDRTTVRDAGFPKEGAIVVDFESEEPQALDGDIVVRHRNGSGYVVPLVSQGQIRGTIQEAVFLLRQDGARAFIALQNTTDSARAATVDVSNGSLHVQLKRIDIAPNGVEIVWIDDVWRRVHVQGGAAIHLVNSGTAGDIVAAGAVVEPSGRYAGRVRFNDLAHGEHQRQLRAEFVLLGSQDPRLGLPAGANFAAQCVLRNATDVVRVLQPKVKWLANGTTQQAILPTVRLQPYEVRVLDLSAAQSRREIPAEFRFGTLELQYDAPVPGHVLAQLTNTDAASGIVLDSAMTDHESEMVSGIQWSTEDGAQTLISFTNAAPTSDSFSVQLYTASGKVTLPPITLAGGSVALVNLRSLPSAMLLGAASGTFSVSGSRGARSSFRLESLFVTPTTLTSQGGDSVGPVAYLPIDGEIRPRRIQSTVWSHKKVRVYRLKRHTSRWLYRLRSIGATATIPTRPTPPNISRVTRTP